MIPINQTPYQTFPSQITGLVQLTIICCGAQVAGTLKKKTVFGGGVKKPINVKQKRYQYQLIIIFFRS